MYGQEHNDESKNEAIGMVIDPSGLTVSSLTATNIMGFVSDAMDSAVGEVGGEKIKSSTEVTSVKLLLPDGKEVPAQIVLRDKDLDLVFIRPLNKPAQPYQAMDLTQAGDAQMLDNVVVMTRLGTVANRAIALLRNNVTAVVEKPRKYYVIESSAMQNVGPAFTQDGKVIGLIVVRKSPVLDIRKISFSEVLAIILPAATIAEVAKQAPEVTKQSPDATQQKPDATKQTPDAAK